MLLADWSSKVLICFDLNSLFEAAPPSKIDVNNLIVNSFKFNKVW